MKNIKKIFGVVLTLLLAVSVFACGKNNKLTDAESVAGAKKSLSTVALSAVTGNFTLSAKNVKNGVTVSWKSNNEAYITVELEENAAGSQWNAVVTQPLYGEAPQAFTLTATLTKGEASDTKEFKGYVIPKSSPLTEYTSVAELLNNSSKGNEVKLTGVVYSVCSKDGFFVTDGTNLMYVYSKGLTPETDASLVEGNVVVVEGQYDIYYGSPQIKVSKYTVGEAATTNTGIKTPVVKSIAEIQAHEYTSTVDVEWYLNTYSVSGVFTMVADGSYTNPCLVDGEGKILSLYYKSNQELLDACEAYEGKNITVNFAYISRNSSKAGTYGEYYAYVINSEISENTMTDADYVASAKVNLVVSKVVSELGTIELASELNGVTVTWASNNETYITNAGEVVLLPEVGADAVVVTLTATLTKGEATDTATFEVEVKAPGYDKISDLLATTDEATVNVAGIVTQVCFKSYYIYDGTASIYVYVGSTTLPAKGDNVILKGATYKVYSNQPELVISTFEATDDLGLTIPDALVVSIADVTSKEATDFTYVGKLVTLTGTISIVDNYVYLSDASGNKVCISKYAGSTKPATTYADKVDQEVTINVIVYNYYSNGSVWNVMDLTA